MTALPNKAELRVDEVAEYFRRHRNTIYLWIEQGLFPGAYQPNGGPYLIPHADVLALARAQKLHSRS